MVSKHTDMNTVAPPWLPLWLVEGKRRFSSTILEPFEPGLEPFEPGLETFEPGLETFEPGLVLFEAGLDATYIREIKIEARGKRGIEERKG